MSVLFPAVSPLAISARGPGQTGLPLPLLLEIVLGLGICKYSPVIALFFIARARRLPIFYFSKISGSILDKRWSSGLVLV